MDAKDLLKQSVICIFAYVFNVYIFGAVHEEIEGTAAMMESGHVFPDSDPDRSTLGLVEQNKLCWLEARAHHTSQTSPVRPSSSDRGANQPRWRGRWSLCTSSARWQWKEGPSAGDGRGCEPDVMQQDVAMGPSDSVRELSSSRWNIFRSRGKKKVPLKANLIKVNINCCKVQWSQ